MRTYVATYKIYNVFDNDKYKDVLNSRNIKYKFVSDTLTENTICYLTIIANNRLQLRKFQRESLKVMKGFGKVELIVGVG